MRRCHAGGPLADVVISLSGERATGYLNNIFICTYTSLYIYAYGLEFPG